MQPKSLMRVQEPDYSGHYLLLPKVCISMKLESGDRVKMEPMYPDVEFKYLH